jgi:hypothetical protein
VHTIADTQQHKIGQNVHQTDPRTVLFELTDMHRSIPRIGEVIEFQIEILIRKVW